MANYLTAAKYSLEKAKKELEAALRMMHASPRTNGGRRATDINVSQFMNVTDGMAQVFADKPVIIIQTMDVRVLQINDRVNAALRALEKIDRIHLRALATKGEQ
jgi:hypothetical protein